MSTLLFGVGAADPLSFGIGASTLLVVAAVAVYLPAHRASRIERWSRWVGKWLRA